MNDFILADIGSNYEIPIRTVTEEIHNSHYVQEELSTLSQCNRHHLNIVDKLTVTSMHIVR